MALSLPETAKTLRIIAICFKFQHIGLSLVAMHPESFPLESSGPLLSGTYMRLRPASYQYRLLAEVIKRELVDRAPKRSKFELARFTVSFRETTAGSWAASPKNVVLAGPPHGNFLDRSKAR